MTLPLAALALLLCLPLILGAQLSYLWPYPSSVSSGSKTLFLNPESFTASLQPNLHPENAYIIKSALDRYTPLFFFSPAYTPVPTPDLLSLSVQIKTPAVPPVLDADMDESYELHIPSGSSRVTLVAPSVWGVLRGLETLSQTITLQDGHYAIRDTPLLVRDSPSFAWRGLLVDSARHFLSVPALLRTIDALAYNKMNVLHWHLVDAESFPLFTPSRPRMSEAGAYVPPAQYSVADVGRVVEYGRLRGVRVVPEVDVPGHTASWGKAYPAITTACPKAVAAHNLNVVPLNPAVNETFEVVRAVLGDVAAMFPDAFLHLGGDEVQVHCWAEDPSVTKFMQQRGWGSDWNKLWAYFETLIQPMWQGRKTMVAWEELLLDQTDYVVPKETVVEAWRFADSLFNITKQGYRGLYAYGNYLDQMQPAGVYRYLWGDTWKTFYQNHPINPAVGTWTPAMESLVLGGEVCMWGEQVDDVNIDARVWPRASAVAERLWSPAAINSVVEATPRMNEHRCRLVRRGIGAGPLSPGNFCPYAYSSKY